MESLDIPVHIFGSESNPEEGEHMPERLLDKWVSGPATLARMVLPEVTNPAAMRFSGVQGRGPRLSSCAKISGAVFWILFAIGQLPARMERYLRYSKDPVFHQNAIFTSVW